VTAVLLLAALAARADVAPPPGYRESCTVERQRRRGETCVECSTFDEQPQACAQEHADDGYVRRCRTSGASAWTEVWCGPAGAPEAPAPPVPTDPSLIPEVAPPVPAPTAIPEAAPSPADPARCGTAGGRALPGAGLLLALGLALARRRGA